MSFEITALLFRCEVMSDSLGLHGLQQPGFPVLHYLLSLLKFMSIKSVMLSNHLILYITVITPLGTHFSTNSDYQTVKPCTRPCVPFFF